MTNYGFVFALDLLFLSFYLFLILALPTKYTVQFHIENLSTYACDFKYFVNLIFVANVISFMFSCVTNVVFHFLSKIFIRVAANYFLKKILGDSSLVNIDKIFEGIMNKPNGRVSRKGKEKEVEGNVEKEVEGNV